MWCVCVGPISWCAKKTVSLDGSHLKVYIKSTKEAECILVGTAIDRMSTFVMLIFHGFTFVIWAAICLTREIWPFMRQFFCSLYYPRCTMVTWHINTAGLPASTQLVCWVTHKSCCNLVPANLSVNLHNLEHMPTNHLDPVITSYTTLVTRHWILVSMWGNG